MPSSAILLKKMYIYVRKALLPHHPEASAETTRGWINWAARRPKDKKMTDREEAEFREEADGLFDNMDRDEMEDWFEGDD